MIHKCIQRFFLFAIRQYVKLCYYFDRCIRASQFTGRTTRTGMLIVLIVGTFAAIAALQWWVATISTLAVPVVVAVGMVAAIVGYQNFNTQIRDLRTQLRLADKEIGKLEETIRRLQAPSRKTRLTRQRGGRATRKIESTYPTQTDGRHLPE